MNMISHITPAAASHKHVQFKIHTWSFLRCHSTTLGSTGLMLLPTLAGSCTPVIRDVPQYDYRAARRTIPDSDDPVLSIPHLDTGDGGPPRGQV